MKTALLLSGGMDSVAIAYWRRPDFGITVDYGQKPAEAEKRASAVICEELDITHLVVEADLSSLGSGDLSGSDALSVAPRSEWWPYRNQMLITLGAMAAISHSVGSLMIGSLASDKHHADGRAEFVKQMDDLLRMQEGSIKVEAPAIEMTAEELIKKSKIPSELLAWAHSCHTANEACGTCGGCLKHYATLENLGRTPY